MKLIVDIPEELHNYIKSDIYDEHKDRRFDFKIRQSMANATPLEKHDEELLDKIRAEIEELRNFRIFRDDVLDIIDKYGKEE